MALAGLIGETFAHISHISNPYKRFPYEFKSFNKTINRLDIEKDAKTGIVADATMVDHTRPAYISAITQMFRGISAINPLGQLGRIEHDIFDAAVLGPPGLKHSWLKKPGKGYTSSFMPEHITNAYHDSGYNPKEIKQDFTSWITPGSYIDPEGRDKPYMAGTAKFPADGQSITIPLVVFGFPDGTSLFAEMLANNDCRVVITIPGGAGAAAVVDITRNENFLSMGGMTDYFCGNPQKNQAINNTTDIAEIKKYVISKELSDFSQILFAIINMIRLRDEQELYSHCMFTTDNVVAARSKLMGLQSCLQDHEITLDKSSHRVILHLAELDPENAARELKATYLNALTKNNNTARKHIAIAIAEGFFYMGTEKYTIREFDGMEEYLQRIIDAIDLAVPLAVGIATALDLTPDLYYKTMLKYYVKTPINERGKVTQSLQRLFLVDAELDDSDPILGKTFGERLQEIMSKKRSRGSRRKTRKFLNLRKMKGGAKRGRNDYAPADEVPADMPVNAPPPAATPDDMPVNDAEAETGPWDGSVVPIVTGTLLHHMRLILQVNESDFENFIFRAFNHLLYICETPLDQRLLYIYENIDRIENSTLDSFKSEYIGYARNPNILALAPLARARLVAARAYDPMEMLSDTQLPLEDLADAQAINLPNAVLNVPTPVNVPNAILNNAYATNAENLPNPPRYQPIFQNIRKGKTEKKKTLIKSTPYYKPGSTPQKRPAYGYFQSMTGLTPRGIHVARKTRKRKNSTFKK